MRNIIAGAAIALMALSSVPRAQEAQRDASAAASSEDRGLDDLASMTFGCPKAALNAAAREAAKVRSQGTYQFSYFKIVSDTHHAAYEVHFKSNYRGERDLKYCVAMYCQQGWDPNATKTTVTLMNDPRKPPAPHGASCSVKPTKR